MRIGLRALHSVVTLVTVATFWAAQAGAQPAPDPKPAEPKAGESATAEQHYQRARQLYEEGDFALALVEFRRAYELSPNYRVLYNIGQVNIQLFNYAAARTALEKFLQDGGADVPAARRSQAEADLKMLRERTAYLQITSKPAGTDISVDDLPVGKAPFEEPLLVNAGQRKIVVAKVGFASVTKLVTLAGGDRTDIKFELVPLPTDKPVIVVPQTTTHKNYTPAVIGWIATGTLALSAGVVGGLYLSKQSEIDELKNPANPVDRQSALDTSSSATRLAVAADVLGLTAIGVGLVSLYFTLRPPQTTVAVSPSVGTIRPTPTGLSVTF